MCVLKDNVFVKRSIFKRLRKTDYRCLCPASCVMCVGGCWGFTYLLIASNAFRQPLPSLFWLVCERGLRCICLVTFNMMASMRRAGPLGTSQRLANSERLNDLGGASNLDIQRHGDVRLTPQELIARIQREWKVSAEGAMRLEKGERFPSNAELNALPVEVRNTIREAAFGVVQLALMPMIAIKLRRSAREKLLPSVCKTKGLNLAAPSSASLIIGCPALAKLDYGTMTQLSRALKPFILIKGEAVVYMGEPCQTGAFFLGTGVVDGAFPSFTASGGPLPKHCPPSAVASNPPQHHHGVTGGVVASSTTTASSSGGGTSAAAANMGSSHSLLQPLPAAVNAGAICGDFTLLTRQPQRRTIRVVSEEAIIWRLTPDDWQRIVGGARQLPADVADFAHCQQVHAVKLARRVDVKSLKQFPEYRSFPHEFLAHALIKMVPKVVKAGTVLYEEGEAATSLFLLVHGDVNLYDGNGGAPMATILARAEIEEIRQSAQLRRPSMLDFDGAGNNAAGGGVEGGLQPSKDQPAAATKAGNSSHPAHHHHRHSSESHLPRITRLIAPTTFGSMSWVQSVKRPATAIAVSDHCELLVLARDGTKAALAACPPECIPCLFPGDSDVTLLQYLYYAQSIPIFSSPYVVGDRVAAMNAVAAALTLKTYAPETSLFVATQQCDRLIIPVSGSAVVLPERTMLAKAECVGFCVLVPHRWPRRVVVGSQGLETLEMSYDQFADILKQHGLLGRMASLCQALIAPHHASAEKAALARSLVQHLKNSHPPLYPVMDGVAALADSVGASSSGDKSERVQCRKPTVEMLRKLPPIPLCTPLMASMFSGASKTRVVANVKMAGLERGPVDAITSWCETPSKRNGGTAIVGGGGGATAGAGKAGGPHAAVSPAGSSSIVFSGQAPHPATQMLFTGGSSSSLLRKDGGLGRLKPIQLGKCVLRTFAYNEALPARRHAGAMGNSSAAVQSSMMMIKEGRHHASTGEPPPSKEKRPSQRAAVVVDSENTKLSQQQPHSLDDGSSSMANVQSASFLLLRRSEDGSSLPIAAQSVFQRSALDVLEGLPMASPTAASMSKVTSTPTLSKSNECGAVKSP